MHAQSGIDLNAVLDNLADYVRDLKDEGVKEVYVSRRGAGSADKKIKAALAEIAAEAAACKRCGLHETRTNSVPGQGNPSPEIMFVGEAPGEDEDLQGLAFVGRAGQLLTKIIEAMGLKRDQVFIANILKCRPPGNRKPEPTEMEVCLPFLQAQIKMLQPRVIVALGATAVEGLLHPPPGFMISRLRGSWHEFDGIPVMPTYHPSYLLRNAAAKSEVWTDMKAVLKSLGRKPPKTVSK